MVRMFHSTTFCIMNNSISVFSALLLMVLYIHRNPKLRLQVLKVILNRHINGRKDNKMTMRHSESDLKI
jgi:hypothetical protein